MSCTGSPNASQQKLTRSGKWGRTVNESALVPSVADFSLVSHRVRLALLFFLDLKKEPHWSSHFDFFEMIKKVKSLRRRLRE